MHRHLRISILLIILLVVGVGTLATQMRVTDWSHTLRVVIYPINADGSEAARDYIAALDAQHFDLIETFFFDELNNYQRYTDEPVHIALSSEVNELPPHIPAQPNIFTIMLWSLKLRYWAFQRDEYQGPRPEVQIFALYHDPKTSPRVKHSTGLEKGHIAVINLFANEKQTDSNLFIIVHELLHTLGASDKYDRATNLPLFPDGYAEPEQHPLYPQTYAEVMGGRIPVTKDESKIPDSLNEVIIGYKTAKEIRLLD